MDLLKWFRRSAQAGQTKSFAEPPFWSTDSVDSLYLTPGWSDRERLEADFTGYAQGGFKESSIVFACITARANVFSEARFQWRQFSNGRPGNLFGSPELALLENPWPGGTTGDLLARMEQDSSLAGNFYATVVDDAGRAGRAATGPGRRIARLRPDWVTIIIGSNSGDVFDADARIVAYLYKPTLGEHQARDGLILLPNEICHHSPIPDPSARFRGMSWLTPVLQEVTSDKAGTLHKGKYFENGGSPRFVVKFDKDVAPEAFDHFVAKMRAEHAGAHNAYKTLVMTPGADVTTVGADLHQLDFSITQGAGETRIAAAARVHPSILGLSEGLKGSSLNAGNFGAAKRLFVDGTMRPLWRMASASLQNLVTPPNSSASLWYDDRDIAFLREDAQDLAKIQQTQAITIRQLLDAGYKPDAAIAYVQSNDLNQLAGSHSGLFSVQLQPPGTVQQPPSTPGITQGGQG